MIKHQFIQFSGAFGLTAALFLSGVGHAARAQAVLTEQQISLALASEAAMATIAHCQAQGYRITVTVVDRGGNVKIVLRDDGAGLHTVNASREKAFTALTFRIPTSEFIQRSENSPELRTVEGVIALAGGLPIRSGDEVIGAIGVGGAPGGDRDEACAQAGIDAIADRL